MLKSRPNRLFVLVLMAIMFLTTIPANAEDKKAKNNSGAGSKPTSSKLDDKENPEKIGKRDINKRQINFYSAEKEVAIGQQLAQEVERTLKLVDDPVVNEYINRVGQNIVLNSDAKVPFTIRVIDSDEINAFALPGGFFFVNKGLILAADNESEIAGVMAHEIAHVAARHGTEQVSKGQLLQFGSIPLIFLGGPIGVLARTGANFALPLTFLKFSRGAENEADILGAQYAWASGYDPAGMVSMFEKLSAKEKNKPGTMAKIFSDHPATGDRADTVRKLIAQFPQREEYIVNTSDFLQVKARLQAFSGGNRNVAAGQGGQGGDRSRPTLKRRRDGDVNGDVDPASAPSEPKDRPTLKRRDSDPGQPQDEQKDDTPAPAPSGRPTLKRSDSGNNGGN